MSNCQDSYPLAPMQTGLLYEDLAADRTGIYVSQIIATLPEDVDRELFTAAWERLQQRYEPLRAALEWENREVPQQRIHATSPIPIEFQDWSDIGPEARESAVAEYLEQDRRRGFDLTRAPLMRLLLIREGPDRHRFVWSFHHVILDGWSYTIVMRELLTVFEALQSGEECELPEVTPYRRYVEWITTQDWTTAESYWRDLLAGFDTPTPIVHACPTDGSDPLGHSERELTLSQQETEALEELATEANVALSTIVQGAWALLLNRYTGHDDVVFGVTRACRSFRLPGARRMVGLFINTLPVRVDTSSEDPLLTWLRDIRRQQVAVWDFEHTPLATVQACAPVERGQGLFDTAVVFDFATLESSLQSGGGAWAQRSFRMSGQTAFPLTLYARGGAQVFLKLAFDVPTFNDEVADRLLGHLRNLLAAMAADAGRRPRDLPMLSPAESQRLLVEWNSTEGEWPGDACVHELVERRACECPDSVALIHRERRLSYRQIQERSTALAARLVRTGVEPGDRLAVFLPRAPEMVTAIVGIMKAGAAYVPVDTAQPDERIAMILEDSGATAVVSHADLAPRLAGHGLPVIDVAQIDELGTGTRVDVEIDPEDLAYVMYTSGSTGSPKGVMVEHRNVVSFFAAMDDAIEVTSPMVWLAVTGLSFDISVLELLWTLSRGATVVLADEQGISSAIAQPAARRPVNLSLFYFASDEARDGNKYELLMEGARFADRNGFHAVWTPERHFHRFGGLYPNPAVASAAVAAVTENIQIRAGSVVGPLHHPLRIAEEWSLVDNLSGGRVGISLASGWQPDDFVLRPEGYVGRRESLIELASLLRRSWRGEEISFPGPNGDDVAVRILPRPVQAELPLWITAAGNPETFRLAGRLRAGVLTHLLGQTVDELRDKIGVYREAWHAAAASAEETANGTTGEASQPTVTVMLHTFLGDDEQRVRQIVREPMKRYLSSAMSLVKAAAWSFPAFRRQADEGSEDIDQAMAEMDERELDNLLEHSFQRYFETSGLFGTVEKARELVDALSSAGVDEIACLIDFGVPVQDVLASLETLARLCTELREQRAVSTRQGSESVAQLIRRHGVTHMQCTPSTMRLLLADPDSADALRALPNLLVGGEALGAELASELRRLAGPDASITNMYGPTETTIWSSTYEVSGDERSVPIGRPIRNTRMYVLDGHLRPVPAGVIGELYIGGPGVARGYLGRPDLTRECFVPDPFREGERLYRTGDLASRRSDGVLEFHGRVDRQVKIRGHRIELGEIEARLDEHPAVESSVLVLQEGGDQEARLVAYYVASGTAGPSAADLRPHLANRLPAHMVPTAFVQLDRFPLTANRKIDHAALPDPDQAAYVRSERTAASEPSEEQARLLEIWQSVLGVKEIGLHDNFFELGGDSLSAVRVMAQLNKTVSRRMPADLLFQFQTLEELSRVVEEARSPAIATR